MRRCYRPAAIACCFIRRHRAAITLEGMPMRTLLTICGLAATLALTSATQADWYSFCYRNKVDFRRNGAWPEPFQSADRALAREYWNIQVNNGWRLQNTVGNCFYEEGSNDLTRAGELKIKQIVTQNPVHRRTVFVLMAETQAVTAKRVDAVQRAVSKYVPEGPLPQILLTDSDVEGGSGDYFDQISNAYRQSIPAPRLDGGGGGGSSGGGSSGGSSGGSKGGK
jgi:uncharacterized membrane protein YgcG